MNEVRPATLADAEIISDLNADVQGLHHQAMPHFFKPPSAGSFPPALVRQLMVFPDSFFFLALEDGRPVGYLYAQVRRLPENPLRYALNMVYIEQIGVQPESQGKGHGRRLLEAAANLARRAGIGLLALDTWSFNKQAHAAFYAFGFESYNLRMWMDVEKAGDLD